MSVPHYGMPLSASIESDGNVSFQRFPREPPGTVTAEAEKRVGPRAANVTHDNSLLKCTGSFMSTIECELGPNSSPTCSS